MRVSSKAPAFAAAFFSIAAVTFAQQAPPVVRPAPDLTVVEPSGKQIPLSSLKGKVVVLDFIFTTCPHCQDEGRMLTKLYREMQPKGLEVLSVAVNDNAMYLVPGFVQQLGIPYPVGYAPRETLLKYMGYSDIDLWVVPQILVIDRKGNVRAQTPIKGDPNLQSETYMRGLLTTLLAEKSAAPAHTTAHAKPSSGTH